MLFSYVMALAATIMRSNDWVDFDDRMTYYRNLVPDAGECMVILLMGTDVVADKGGLSDFFAITPYTLDITIGDRVSRLMGAQLRRQVCGGDDTVEKICDAFLKTLFECVPGNLSRASAIMYFRFILCVTAAPVPVSRWKSTPVSALGLVSLSLQKNLLDIPCPLMLYLPHAVRGGCNDAVDA